MDVSYYTRNGKVKVIRDLSLTLDRGETFGVVGESGCGKTTLAFSIIQYLGKNGFVDSGKINFLGENLRNRNEREMRDLWGNAFSIVYQDPSSALNPSFRTGKQIKEVFVAKRGKTGKEAKIKTIESLKEMDISDPEIVYKSYPHQLSGGMKQRVCLAMAFASDPEVMILDEPTTNLDVTVESNILDLVNNMKDKINTTILYITHDLGIVHQVSDRIGVMYGGQFLEKGPTDEVISNPIHPYTQGLLNALITVNLEEKAGTLKPIPGSVVEFDNLPSGCIFHPRCPFNQKECETVVPELEEVNRGHLVRCSKEGVLNQEKGFDSIPESDERDFSKRKTSDDCEDRSSDILQVKELKKYFNDKSSFLPWSKQNSVKAVDNVSFTISKSNVLGVVGESGCGKTTMLRTIAGLEEITEGQVQLDEKDISEPVKNREQKSLDMIRIVFQDPRSTLNPKQTVGRILRRPVMITNKCKREEADRISNNLLKMVGLRKEHRNRYPDQLSGGQKQRVAIARAFASQPELILCDEPTSSLDVSIQASIINLLLDLQNERNISYIFISHNLALVSYISRFMAVMYLGKFLEFGPTEKILKPPYHPYTEALLSSVPTLISGGFSKRVKLTGPVPSARNIPQGCRFHTRCPKKIGEICEQKTPPAQSAGENHFIHCHIPLDKLKADFNSKNYNGSG